MKNHSVIHSSIQTLTFYQFLFNFTRQTQYVNQEKIMDEATAQMRREYTKRSLDIHDVHPNPVQQFQQWFDEATKAQLPEPNAMTLSTVSPEGKPSARIVLLKGVKEGSFVFYTNYQSRKGHEMETHPQVALTFFWVELERQVRIEGTTHKISEERSIEYFHSRPRGSQIAAWVSSQSQKIADRTVLEQRLQEFTQKFEGQTIPKPPYWGGYAVVPQAVEFWQGRPSRLHDRILYTLQNENNWKIERLAP